MNIAVRTEIQGDLFATSGVQVQSEYVPYWRRMLAQALRDAFEWRVDPWTTGFSMAQCGLRMFSMLLHMEGELTQSQAARYDALADRMDRIEARFAVAQIGPPMLRQRITQREHAAGGQS